MYHTALKHPECFKVPVLIQRT